MDDERKEFQNDDRPNLAIFGWLAIEKSEDASNLYAHNVTSSTYRISMVWFTEGQYPIKFELDF